MPTAQHQAMFTSEEAERFAKLWAGFDTSNASEAEAMGKGRALRRMLAGKKFADGKDVRLVDAFGLDEIRQALDVQMQPERSGASDVQAAMEQSAALREELTERIRDVRNLAAELAGCEERLSQRERECETLRGRLNSIGVGPCRCGGVRSVMGDTWLTQVLFLFVGLLVLIAAWVLDVVHFIERCITWLFH